MADITYTLTEFRTKRRRCTHFHTEYLRSDNTISCCKAHQMFWVRRCTQTNLPLVAPTLLALSGKWIAKVAMPIGLCNATRVPEAVIQQPVLLGPQNGRSKNAAPVGQQRTLALRPMESRSFHAASVNICLRKITDRVTREEMRPNKSIPNVQGLAEEFVRGPCGSKVRD